MTDQTIAPPGVVSSTELGLASPGWRVRFAEERNGYTVQARSERYIVCTKPFPLHKTVLYTVIDLVEQVRGTEGRVFGGGAETREQCEEMIDRLEGLDDDIKTDVSYRNRVPLRVIAVKPNTEAMRHAAKEER